LAESRDAQFVQPLHPRRFAGIVGVGRTAIGRQLRTGKLTKGATAGEWVAEYCAHLRAAAAGRGADSEDLTAKRTRKTRIERQREEIKLEQDLATFAPVAVLEATLGTLGATIVAVLKTLPASIQRQCPGLSPAGGDIVQQEVARACAAAETAALQLAADDEPLG